MTTELHSHAMRRKEKTEELISEAHDKITEIHWINPNGYPVYLEFHYAALLRDIQREVGELLARHDKDERELWTQPIARTAGTSTKRKVRHGRGSAESSPVAAEKVS